VEDHDPTSSRAVAEYLSDLENATFGAALPTEPKSISPTDPAAHYTAAADTPAVYAYWAVEIVLWPGCTVAVDHVITRYPDACIWQKSELFDTIVEEIKAAETGVANRATDSLSARSTDPFGSFNKPL
jgi:hypothetical protein